MDQIRHNWAERAQMYLVGPVARAGGAAQREEELDSGSRKEIISGDMRKHHSSVPSFQQR